jgi:hypothetical protein
MLSLPKNKEFKMAENIQGQADSLKFKITNLMRIAEHQSEAHQGTLKILHDALADLELFLASQGMKSGPCDAIRPNTGGFEVKP